MGVLSEHSVPDCFLSCGLFIYHSACLSVERGGVVGFDLYGSDYCLHVFIVFIPVLSIIRRSF